MGIRTVVLNAVACFCSIFSVLRVRLLHYGSLGIRYYFGFLQVCCSGLGIVVWFEASMQWLSSSTEDVVLGSFMAFYALLIV